MGEERKHLRQLSLAISRLESDQQIYQRKATTSRKRRSIARLRWCCAFVPPVVRGTSQPLPSVQVGLVDLRSRAGFLRHALHLLRRERPFPSKAKQATQSSMKPLLHFAVWSCKRAPINTEGLCVGARVRAFLRVRGCALQGVSTPVRALGPHSFQLHV